MDFLLDAAPDIVDGGGAEFHDMEGIDNNFGVGHSIWMMSLN